MGIQSKKPLQSFAGLVAGHYGRTLQRYFMRCLNHPQDARDLEQEVYLRLLRIDDSELIHNPKSYVFRVAAHVIFEFRDRARRDRVVVDSRTVEEWAKDSANAWPDVNERISTEQQLEGMLEHLQPLTRAVFLLQKRDGLSREEVAGKLGISPHTVKKHMLRAIAVLRAAHWDSE